MTRFTVGAAFGALLAGFAVGARAQTSTTTGNPLSFPYGVRQGGTYAATILGMAVSPRAVGLGEAMAAVEGDASSLFYNAAGIARIKTNSFMVTGSQRFGDTQLAGAVVTFPTALGTFGIGARAFNAGTVENTENYQPTGGRSRGYQLALEGGGAIQLTDHWLWGGTLFYAQETLGEQSAGSVGVNSGMMLTDIFRRLSIGFGVRNYGTKVSFDTQQNKPPLYGYLGGALDLFKHRDLLQTPMLFRGEPLVVDAKLVGQLSHYEGTRCVDGDRWGCITLDHGIEGTVNGVAIGRIGYQWGADNRRGLSLGAGINVGQFRLEYAYRNRHNAGASFFSYDPVGNEHHVGASYYWGGEKSNVPLVPVIVTQAIDTAAINAAVRAAVDQQLAQLRPLLDSLRNRQVEVRQESDLVSKYIVPVHFGFDSAAVRDTDYAVLGQVADVIRRVYPTAVVTIEGFADPAGTQAYNLALSQRRADAVKRVMVDRFGLPDRQFKTVGYGKQPIRQVTPGARRDAPGAEQNRRVTFTIDATQHY